MYCFNMRETGLRAQQEGSEFRGPTRQLIMTLRVCKHASFSDLREADSRTEIAELKMRKKTYLHSNNGSKGLNVGIPEPVQIVCHEAKELDIGFHCLCIEIISMLIALDVVYEPFYFFSTSEPCQGINHRRRRHTL